jgi:hypothetical protein
MSNQIEFLESEIAVLQFKIQSPFRDKRQRREDQRRSRELRERLERLKNDKK